MASSSHLRDDVQIIACKDHAYTEFDEEFYGKPISVELGEDSDDEDTTGTNTNFDIHAAISGVDTTTTEGDQQTFLIPDMDGEKLVVQSKVQNGCGCPHNCYNQFSEDEVYYSRLQMLELEKGERHMLLLGKLMVCGRTASSVSHARKVTATKRQRVTYEFHMTTVWYVNQFFASYMQSVKKF